MAEQVHPPEGLMEHPEEHPEVRHEFSDVSFRWIVGALMTAGVLGAVIHFAIGFFFEARKEALDVARSSPYPLAPRPSTALPPEPRLEQLDRMKQRTEPTTLDKGQANLVRLSSLGTTEDKDFVHIPIERALQLLAGKLPARDPLLPALGTVGAGTFGLAAAPAGASPLVAATLLFPERAALQKANLKTRDNGLVNGGASNSGRLFNGGQPR